MSPNATILKHTQWACGWKGISRHLHNTLDVAKTTQRNKDNRTTFVDISSTYTAFSYSNPTMETPELWKKSIQIWSFMSFRCLS